MKKFAWSFSALSMFEQCRKKYYHIRVLKDAKDDDSQFAGEGKLIHDSMKKRVIDGVPLPIDLRYLEPIAKRFADAKGEKRGELQLAITDKFEATAWNDWDGVWCRAIIDLLILPTPTSAIIVDWKTGKRKDEWDQIKLSAAVLSCVMPEIEEFKLTYVWTKSKQMTPPLTLKREHMPAVWSNYIERVEAILDATKTTDFPATESPLCGWCPVKQCPHHP